MPGGMSGVMIAEVAVTTDENSSEKPRFVISGTSILASIAASARFEPESPPISVESRMATCARPPTKVPRSTLQKFMMRFVTPV